MLKLDGNLEKLKGSENYDSWSFTMKHFLALHKLKNCIIKNDKSTEENPIAVEEKDEKLDQALSYLVLNVEKSFYPLVKKCETPIVAWNTLRAACEDKGAQHCVGLLHKFVSIRLENHDSMQTYIDELLHIKSKLEDLDFPVGDKWLSGIMLLGLPEEFNSFILGLAGGKMEWTPDQLRLKLLDLNYSGAVNQSAFLSKNNRFQQKKKQQGFFPFKCNKCNEKGHKAADCPNKNSNETIKPPAVKNKPNSKKAFLTFASNNGMNNKSSDWFIDSGASIHMTPDEKLIKNRVTTAVNQIIAANNSTMKVNGKGKVNLKVNNFDIEVDEVLYVPELSANLLSISKMVEKGNTITFNSEGCTVYDDQMSILVNCKPIDGIYKINGGVEKCMLTAKQENSMVWHKRLGHINHKDLCKMRDGVVSGIKFADDMSMIKACETCAYGKHARLPFKSSNSRSENKLDLIHSDLCGPMENKSIGGARYFMTFIDDFSRKCFVYFLKSKKEAFTTFIEFKTWIEKQSERKIKVLRSDNGTEYCSGEFIKFYKQNGIEHQLTNVYTPQQNGTAERMNRTIVERSKCMLIDANLHVTYWAEAVNMAVYIINRSASSLLVDKTPEEIWSGSKVDLSDLKMFGSSVMVHIPKENRKKWDVKSMKMIFVGYDSEKKGYRCINKSTRKLTVSRDVIFHETLVGIYSKGIDMEDELDSVRDNARDVDHIDEQNESLLEESKGTIMLDVPVISSDDSHTTVIDPNDPDELITSSSEVRRSSRVPKPNRKYVADLTCRTMINNQADDPFSVDQAMSRHDAVDWKNAMQDEISSLMENKTWSLVDLPSGRKAIKSKWVFKTKMDADGNIVRHKARLVAKGCSQIYGLDYEETYSPVVRYASIRVLMAIAVKHKLKVHQMDAVTAFLQGELHEEIYMQQPEMYNDGTKQVCRLNRAIYGLKQAGREWNMKLEAALKSFGFEKSKMDPCVYFIKGNQLILAIYVDDILIFWKDEAQLKEIKRALGSAFKMKDMGPAKECVGIRITQGENNIQLDQSSYAEEILKRFGMQECKPISTPADPNQKLSLNMPMSEINGEEVKNVPYQEAVGSLLYLVQGTRPDLAFAVNDVSRFNTNHSLAHWKAVKRIFRYLKGTIDYKLTFTNEGDSELVGYSDADWGSDIDKRRSCTGYVFKLCNGAVTWSSKRQPTVALSSTEAEYMALASTVQEVIWLKQFCSDFLDDINTATTILCDNQGAIKLAESDGFRQRSKHIDIKHHFLREKVKDSTINIKYIPTNEMVADGLTKAVTKEKQVFCNKLMNLQ